MYKGTFFLCFGAYNGNRSCVNTPVAFYLSFKRIIMQKNEWSAFYV
ncbi:MAG: hypothetical protein RR639_06575 [Hydrogenoanaerobacterium sp.]